MYSTIPTSDMILHNCCLLSGEGLTLEALDEVLAGADGGIFGHAQQRVDHARGHGLALQNEGRRDCERGAEGKSGKEVGVYVIRIFFFL